MILLSAAVSLLLVQGPPRQAPPGGDVFSRSAAHRRHRLEQRGPAEGRQLLQRRDVVEHVETAGVRYTPASDTSVLGNRVWVARNQPYAAIINYYLPADAGSVELTVRDRPGRVVQTLAGSGKAGLNRTVWNLAERSPCADDGSPTAGGGRGGRGGGTWLRAVPGEYTVTLTAAGTEIRQAFTVRKDPRLTVSDADMAAWHQEASLIVETECALQRASADLAQLERRVIQLEREGRTDEAAAVRKQLRTIVLVLRGDPRDPGHVNLPGRVNWLTIQVGNNSGRPTRAQSEWIRTYAAQAEAVAKAVAALRK